MKNTIQMNKLPGAHQKQNESPFKTLNENEASSALHTDTSMESELDFSMEMNERDSLGTS